MVPYLVIKSHLEKVEKSKFKFVEKLPPLTNVKRIKSFLGHVGFYRMFIRDFYRIPKPLYNLLKKNTTFQFDT